jgi:hypothetical protein
MIPAKAIIGPCYIDMVPNDIINVIIDVRTFIDTSRRGQQLSFYFVAAMHTNSFRRTGRTWQRKQGICN